MIRYFKSGLSRVLVRYLVLLGLAGCDGSGAAPIDSFAPVTDPEKLYMRLVIDRGAVTLSTIAPFNTIQLTATPLDGSGTPMAGLPAPTFRLQQLSDSTKVLVTKAGLVTGRQQATGVRVIAELATADNIQQADTAVVNVNVTPGPIPPELATLSIDPIPPDSAIVPIAVGTELVIGTWLQGVVRHQPGLGPNLQARTSTGELIPGLAVEYVSLDPTIAQVDRRNGAIRALRPGKVGFVARTFTYGVSKEAMAEFTITTPVLQTVVVRQHLGMSIFGPAPTIRPYGLVIWLNDLNQPVDVVFDDPTLVAEPSSQLCTSIQTSPILPAPNACGTGDFTIPARAANIAPLPYNFAGARIRQFPTVGTYTYRDARTGATGKVVVTDGMAP